MRQPNVGHALDSKGNEVVIKMYVKMTDERGRLLDEKDFGNCLVRI